MVETPKLVTALVKLQHNEAFKTFITAFREKVEELKMPDIKEKLLKLDSILYDLSVISNREGAKILSKSALQLVGELRGSIEEVTKLCEIVAGIKVE